jgi:hypothetical protein
MEASGISRRKLAWIIFLSLCTLIGGWHAWENYRYQAASQAWCSAANLAERQCDAQSSQAYCRVSPLIRSLPEHERSKEQVETALALPPPSQRWPKEDGGEWCLYQDPVTQGYFALGFRVDRTWGSTASGRPSGAIYRVPKPSRDLLFGMSETTRSWVAERNGGLGPPVWLVLLALLPFMRGRRRLICELMLGLALVCSVAWLLDPTYSFSLRSILRNEMMFWAVLMLVASSIGMVLVALLSDRSTPPRPPECDCCGYNLTGNVSGVCPECGEPVVDSVPTPKERRA